MKKLTHTALGLVLAFSMAGAAIAADEVNVAPGGTAQGPGIAVQGYDVISYRLGTPSIGKSEYAIAFEGGTYLFASEANMKVFEANPARFVPAYGGFCAYGVAKGKKFNGDPLVYDLVDDVLYLNINDDVQGIWAADAGELIEDAERAWTNIRSKAASKL